ncbi:uncharacterized protein LOC114525796 [Dendronephthya gigantea]|uniref:uncharacterized protein LOC114525796 n=1 Tax=Dendronephthya gigantea TaxID=151771 RepID=UPI00106A20BD|nr:uncharacterized protein LOC114525796 [Dendronephthya gigantea]
MTSQQKRWVCGRGVLALKSCEPLRRPRREEPKDPQAPRPPLEAIHGPNPKLLVKYSYKKNPNQPGGFPELTVRQRQNVTFLNVHETESLWWNVKDEDSGESGYVPGSYLMILEEKPSSLPWLENRRLEAQEETKKKEGPFKDAPTTVWKPYVSAYGGTTTGQNNQPPNQYYCEICDKQLNGPKPFQAHMVSKAHKEEVAAQS